MHTPEISMDKRRLSSLSQGMQHFYKLASTSSLGFSKGPYNLTIGRKKKFIWFRVAKVCTRSIFKCMEDNKVVFKWEHPFDVYYAPCLSSSYYKFAFVRNPWDRLVSCWHDKIVGYNYFNLEEKVWNDLKRFESFVEYVDQLNLKTCDNHLRMQTALIDLENIDFVGKFENFSSDFKIVCDNLQLNESLMRKENASEKREQYQQYYNEVLRKKVSRIYSDDIEAFKYVYD